MEGNFFSYKILKSLIYSYGYVPFRSQIKLQRLTNGALKVNHDDLDKEMKVCFLSDRKRLLERVSNEEDKKA